MDLNLIALKTVQLVAHIPGEYEVPGSNQGRGNELLISRQP